MRTVPSASLTMKLPSAPSARHEPGRAVARMVPVGATGAAALGMAGAAATTLPRGTTAPDRAGRPCPPGVSATMVYVCVASEVVALSRYTGVERQSEQIIRKPLGATARLIMYAVAPGTALHLTAMMPFPSASAVTDDGA